MYLRNYLYWLYKLNLVQHVNRQVSRMILRSSTRAKSHIFDICDLVGEKIFQYRTMYVSHICMT